MIELTDKLKDWKELRQITNQVRDFRGEAQHKAYETFVSKSREYVVKYKEKFNPFKRPQ